MCVAHRGRVCLAGRTAGEKLTHLAAHWVGFVASAATSHESEEQLGSSELLFPCRVLEVGWIDHDSVKFADGSRLPERMWGEGWEWYDEKPLDQA